MKKKVLIGVCSIFFIVLAVILSIALFKCDDNVILSDNTKNKNLVNNSFITLMLEDESGNYVKSTSNTWPSGNYAFNESLSRCERGGELRWDREKGIVNLLSNKSDKCYVYFDLYNVVEISKVDATKTTNSITVSVTTSGGENPVDKYYFSIDEGKTYQESSTPSYTFSNLTMNHEYTIQVYAKDTLGYESNEEVIKVTTDNYINPVVNSVSASNITSNSVKLTINATAGSNSIAKYYYSSNNGSSYVSSSSNTYTFNNLSAGTTYNFRVYVVDNLGVKSNEKTTSATTSYVNPTANRISVTNTTSNSITVSVSASGGTNSVRTYYYSINNGSYVSSTSSSYTFDGLNPNTTYSIRAYVADTAGKTSNTVNTSGTTQSDLIRFYVMFMSNRRTFTAEEGMTWGEYMLSSYNTAGFYYNPENDWIEVYSESDSNTYVLADFSSAGEYVTPYDVIVAGRTYAAG